MADLGISGGGSKGGSVTRNSGVGRSAPATQNKASSESPATRTEHAKDRFTPSQSMSDAGLMDPKAMRAAVGGTAVGTAAGSAAAPSASEALAARYAEAGGDRAKLEAVSNEAWDKAQAIMAGLPPEAQQRINTDYKGIVGIAANSGADEALSGVTPGKAEAIRGAFPGDQAAQMDAFGKVVGAQKEEHQWMAQMLSMRDYGTSNNNPELAGLADTYLRSRNDFNGVRDFVTVLGPEMQLGK